MQWRIQDFPEGGAIPDGGGRQPAIWQELHEYERNSTGGGGGPKHPPRIDHFYDKIVVHLYVLKA